jgi:hypothetical protein
MVLTNRNRITRPQAAGKAAMDVDARKSFVAVGGASCSPHAKGVRLDPGRSPNLTVKGGLGASAMASDEFGEVSSGHSRRTLRRAKPLTQGRNFKSR